MDNSLEQKVIDVYRTSSIKSTIEITGVSNTEIYRILKEHNISLKKVKKTQEIVEKVVDLYFKENSCKKIAKELGCGIDLVLDIIREQGIRHCFRKAIKYNPFENYLNPHVQYWLGVLATDGCVSDDGKISLTQCEKNKDIIYKFQEFLLNKVNIREVIHKKYGKEFKQFAISFRNKEVADYLTNIIGITPRKTDTLEIKIPITFDFLRGAIEGDGSIEVNYNRIRLCSNSILFMKQVSELLNVFNIVHHIYLDKIKTKSHDLQINEHKSVLRLLDFLYYNGCTTLERKYINAQYIRNDMLQRFKFRELSLENPERNP